MLSSCVQTTQDVPPRTGPVSIHDRKRDYQNILTAVCVHSITLTRTTIYRDKLNICSTLYG